jgi:hypothetical protein
MQTCVFLWSSPKLRYFYFCRKVVRVKISEYLQQKPYLYSIITENSDLEKEALKASGYK